MQFRGKIAGVGRPAASRSATSYLDLLASYPGYEANVRGYPRSQASQTSFGTQGAMARLTRARICDYRSSAESSLRRKTKGTCSKYWSGHGRTGRIGCYGLDMAASWLRSLTLEDTQTPAFQLGGGRELDDHVAYLILSG